MVQLAIGRTILIGASTDVGFARYLSARIWIKVGAAFDPALMWLRTFYMLADRRLRLKNVAHPAKDHLPVSGIIPLRLPPSAALEQNSLPAAIESIHLYLHCGSTMSHTMIAFGHSSSPAHLFRYRMGMPLTSPCDGDVLARCSADKLTAAFLERGYIQGCLVKHALQLHRPCWALVSTMDDR